MGKGQTGGKVAAPIFGSMMKQILKNKPAIPFRVPPGIKLVQVNLKTGLRAAQETKTPYLKHSNQTKIQMVLIPSLALRTPMAIFITITKILAVQVRTRKQVHNATLVVVVVEFGKQPLDPLFGYKKSLFSGSGNIVVQLLAL